VLLEAVDDVSDATTTNRAEPPGLGAAPLRARARRRPRAAAAVDVSAYAANAGQSVSTTRSLQPFGGRPTASEW